MSWLRRYGKHAREKRFRKPSRFRPAPDILPTARRPPFEAPMLPRDRHATHCPHGIEWHAWCEKCERGEIRAAIDTQLAGA